MCIYHPGKANVVDDDFSRLYICSVSHVQEKRKDVVKYVHRLSLLGVHLMSISDISVIV